MTLPPPATSAAGAASPPVRIAIPAIDAYSALGPPRGLNANGTINDAPLTGPNWSKPWWYDQGSTPGQNGSSVLLGHVDSATGAGHLGVFFRLGSLEAGEAITVSSANGSVTHWVIDSTVLYPDNNFPDNVVYNHSGPPTLRLVTCGGTYNWQSHGYQSAVVVTAHLTSA